jgi:hypothetical protein
MQNPSQTNGYKLNNIRLETRTVRNEKRKYVKEKINLKQTEQKYKRHTEA